MVTYHVRPSLTKFSVPQFDSPGAASLKRTQVTKVGTKSSMNINNPVKCYSVRSSQLGMSGRRFTTLQRWANLARTSRYETDVLYTKTLYELGHIIFVELHIKEF